MNQQHSKEEEEEETSTRLICKTKTPKITNNDAFLTKLDSEKEGMNNTNETEFNSETTTTSIEKPNEEKNLKIEKVLRPAHLIRHPETWTKSEIREWLEWCAAEYALNDIPFNKFEMNGKALWMLTEDMFKQRVPNSGDILFKALRDLLPNETQTSKVYTSENRAQIDLLKSSLANSELQTTCASSNTPHNSEIVTSLNHTNLANKTASVKSDLSFESLTETKSELEMKPINKNCAQTLSKSKYQTSLELLKLFNSNFKENEANNAKNCDEKVVEASRDDDNDDEDDDELNNEKETNDEEKTESNHDRKRRLSPIVNNRKSGSFERKRTANLENLIGNLKVRKMNQSGSGKSVDIDTTASSIEYTSEKMNSLYVDVIHGGSLSDCSPSTPPLSLSPSISPSSLSIASPDSPIQSHASSILSSNNEQPKQVKLEQQAEITQPKFRWMMESSSSQAVNNTNTEPEEWSAIEKVKEEPSEEFNGAEENCEEEELEVKPSKPASKTSRVAKKLGKESSVSPGSKSSISAGAKNQEDPTRQIKFYDDFIDFRGDILRRPANSKNCRILWEYLYLLLQDNNYNGVIRWEDPIQMVFRIVQAEKLAALWGLQKNRLGMTYEKLSRGMRYYYPNNIIAREPGRRLLYRFMRHPSEIKKFVKKNGTYMLKRSTKSGKNEPDDANPDDSGVDEPLNKSTENTESCPTVEQSSKKLVKKPNHSKTVSKTRGKVKSESLEHEDAENEEGSEEFEEGSEVNSENRNEEGVNDEKTSQEDDNKTEPKPKFPFVNNSSSSSNNSVSSNGDSMLNSAQSKTTMAAAAIAANHFYPELYSSAHEMLQYYAQYLPNAAFYNHQSNQRLTSTTDDVSAAQYLLQLRNNNNNNNNNQQSTENQSGNQPSAFCDPAAKQFFNETMKNFTNSLNSIHRQNLSTKSSAKQRRPNEASSAQSTSSSNNDFAFPFTANTEHPLNLSLNANKKKKK